MANGTLHSLFRESKERPTDRSAFAQVMSRLSGVRIKKSDDERKQAADKQKAN